MSKNYSFPELVALVRRIFQSHGQMFLHGCDLKYKDRLLEFHVINQTYVITVTPHLEKWLSGVDVTRLSLGDMGIVACELNYSCATLAEACRFYSGLEEPDVIVTDDYQWLVAFSSNDIEKGRVSTVPRLKEWLERNNIKKMRAVGCSFIAIEK